MHSVNSLSDASSTPSAIGADCEGWGHQMATNSIAFLGNVETVKSYLVKSSELLS